MRVLILADLGAALLQDLAASPFGPFEIVRCIDAAQAQAQLEVRGADAVLVDAPLARGWLNHAGALAVIGWGAPAAGLAIEALQRGVQDVIAPTDTTLDLGWRVRAAIERARSADESRRALGIDLATGLPHERQLIEHMSHLLALREREPAPMALVVLRIEGFGSTQARLGVEAANVLRRKVAVRLRGSVRASDVVAALRDDLYAVLLVSMLAAHDAERVALKMRASLAAPFQVAGVDASVAVALGIALPPADGSQAAALLQRGVALALTATAPGRGGERNTAAANDG